MVQMWLSSDLVCTQSCWLSSILEPLWALEFIIIVMELNSAISDTGARGLLCEENHVCVS